MRKLMSVLFGAVLAVSLAMPVVAQDTGSSTAAPKAEKTAKKSTKSTKAHKGGKKATKKAAESSAAPQK